MQNFHNAQGEDACYQVNAQQNLATVQPMSVATHDVEVLLRFSQAIDVEPVILFH